MMNRALLAVSLLFAIGLFAADSDRITATSVWQMPVTFPPAVHKACDNAPNQEAFAICFMQQMSKAGASPEAVEFTKLLRKQSHGDVGVMTGFNKVGPVDVAFVTYPLRANTNNGLLFVNGDPKIVNAEDLKLLNQKDMMQSPQFQNTKAQFPQVAVWPGDRDGTTWPNSNPNSEGGVSFTLGYPLINGCHACARAGFAEFNWKFGPTGKFLGTSFMGMTPPPVK